MIARIAKPFNFRLATTPALALALFGLLIPLAASPAYGLPVQDEPAGATEPATDPEAATEPADAPAAATEPAAEPVAQPVKEVAPAEVSQDDEAKANTPVADEATEPIEELVNINLQSQRVDEIIEFIVRWTGKVVMVQEQALLSKKITVMSEKKVTKKRALEILYTAFKINDLAVVETNDMIMIDSINELANLQPGVVLGPEVDIEALPDDGTIVIKVFQITEAKAQDIFDRLDATKPEFVNITVDPNSNQLIVDGDVGYAKRVARLIRILDVEPYIAVRTVTFRLQYADAATIADQIEILFASSGTTSTRPTSNTQSRGARPTQGRTSSNTAVVEVGTSEQLTVTVLQQTNSITVRAEPDIIEEIDTLLKTAWDIAPSREGDIFRIYDLRYTDPLKVKDLLQALLEGGGGGSAGAARGGAGAQRTSGATSGADAAVANIFKIEAYPDSNRLIVISKSPSNFEWLDHMIERIDQPLIVGMPVNIELKHASAIEVAEILNALLSAGGSASLSAPDEGLSGIDFAAGGADASTGTEAGQNQISFPWNDSRTASGDETPVSALVGKARVVPNSSQNSLLVLATPEIQEAVLKIITDLDRPGRQVMITAILAEVELGDDYEFGIRFGQGIVPGDDDNAIVVNGAGGSIFAATMNPVFPNTFSGVGSSILNFGVDATVILQALNEVTNTRILQQPRIFTSDNKEAKFFDGQDVPFQASSSQSAGDTVATFDQIAVGIGVNVRPRITKDRNVAMEIEILLSNLGAIGVGGNPIINRRQTNTTVTVKNGQTIVLSGIRQESESTIKRKVPLLGDIPILDLLFSSESEATTVSELLVFITPIVVDNPDENDTNFNEKDRERLLHLTDPMTERSNELKAEIKATGSDKDSPTDPRRD